MSNTQNPNRRRKMRKTYTLSQVQKIGSEAIRCAQDIILSQDTSYELKVRAVHAVSNLQSSYAKLSEAVSLEDRLKKLERLYEASNN